MCLCACVRVCVHAYVRCLCVCVSVVVCVCLCECVRACVFPCRWIHSSVLSLPFVDRPFSRYVPCPIVACSLSTPVVSFVHQVLLFLSAPLCIAPVKSMATITRCVSSVFAREELRDQCGCRLQISLTTTTTTATATTWTNRTRATTGGSALHYVASSHSQCTHRLSSGGAGDTGDAAESQIQNRRRVPGAGATPPNERHLPPATNHNGTAMDATRGVCEGVVVSR